jgi:hypothetical protein
LAGGFQGRTRARCRSRRYRTKRSGIGAGPGVGSAAAAARKNRPLRRVSVEFFLFFSPAGPRVGDGTFGKKMARKREPEKVEERRRPGAAGRGTCTASPCPLRPSSSNVIDFHKASLFVRLVLTCGTSILIRQDIDLGESFVLFMLFTRRVGSSWAAATARRTSPVKRTGLGRFRRGATRSDRLSGRDGRRYGPGETRRLMKVPGGLGLFRTNKLSTAVLADSRLSHICRLIRRKLAHKSAE